MFFLVFLDFFDIRSSAFEGTVPPHFYGEMAKTDLGCQILQEKGHFAEFAEFIRLHSNESDDTEVILKLKSILWAVVSVH
jgi:large subunit ribosomal protein L17e